MSYFYTLAPIACSPESLVIRFPNPVTLAAWNRYGSYCPETTPAFITTTGSIPIFNADITEAHIAIVDPESETPIVIQALQAIGSHLFTPEADKPIILEAAIGDALYRHPIFRLIDFNYEGTSEGKHQLEADCLTATGINLDLRKSLETLKQEAWNAVKATLTTEA